MALYKYFRRVNKDEDDKKLLVLPVPKELKWPTKLLPKPWNCQSPQIEESTPRSKLVLFKILLKNKTTSSTFSPYYKVDWNAHN